MNTMVVFQDSSLNYSPFNSPSKLVKKDERGDSTFDMTDDGDEDIDVTAADGVAGTSGGIRRRAPRALTGRFVRPGTGASKETLAILRKKLLERLKLKELLGENSHLYFGALNKQKGNRKSIEAAKKKLAISM